jgi:type IV pilus assembly protein PilV
MRRCHRQPRGFSLIEVLIGLVILAVGLLALAGLQVTSIRGNFFSNSLMQATYAAQDRLEFLKYLSFDSAPLQPGNYGDGMVTLSGVAFDRTYTVVVNGNLKNITYTVTWNDGTNHRVSFSTIRSQ